MKTLSFKLMLALWPFAALIPSAQAFQDPSLGRWLNRDPMNGIELREGANLFRFVKNTPLLVVDAFGYESWMPGGRLPFQGATPAAQPSIGVQQAAEEAEKRNFNPYFQPDPYGGGFRHCMASCLLRRKYGVGIAGIIVVGRDILYEDLLGKPDANNRSDIASERVGLDLAGWDGSCESLCLERYPPICGPVPPPHLRRKKGQ